jgi:hypothetical protein
VLADSDVGTRPDGTRARVNRVRYSKHFFPYPTSIMKEAFRAAAAEQRGEDVEADEGSWKLQEIAPLPRDEQGHVDMEAAQEQYKRLVSERIQEANTEPVKLSKGGKQVLAFMVLQSLRLGNIEVMIEQESEV